MPVDLGMARKRSSKNQNPMEAPVEVVTLQIWAAEVASAGLVRNWLDSTEARRLKMSIEYRCRLMFREEGVECRAARHELRYCTAVRYRLRYCTAVQYWLWYCTAARHGLLKMGPYINVALGRAW